MLPAIGIIIQTRSAVSTPARQSSAAARRTSSPSSARLHPIDFASSSQEDVICIFLVRSLAVQYSARSTSLEDAAIYTRIGSPKFIDHFLLNNHFQNDFLFLM